MPNYYEIISILAQAMGKPKASFKACMAKLEEMAQNEGGLLQIEIEWLLMPESRKALKLAHAEFRKARIPKALYWK